MAEPPAADGEPDLFGKIWTYQELLDYKPPTKVVVPKEVPSHWPENVAVDNSKWVFWLPEGWGQGIKTTVTGGKLKCYVAPLLPDQTVSKLYYHKKDIEALLKRELPKQERKEPKESGERALRSIHEAVPLWPEGDWLPKDWRLVFRRLPTGLHKCYVPPGQDEGFLYHRATVMDYLSGKDKKVSPFGTSRPMAAISAEVERRSTRKRSRRYDNDNETADRRPRFFALAPSPASSASSSSTASPRPTVPSSKEDAAQQCTKLRAILTVRGFSKNVELVAVLGDAPKENPFADRIRGVYYQMSEVVGGRRCYQRLLCINNGTTSKVACDRVYIIWSEKQTQWQITTAPADGAPVYAVCSIKEPLAQLSEAPWRLRGGQEGGDAEAWEDCGLRAIVPLQVPLIIK